MRSKWTGLCRRGVPRCPTRASAAQPGPSVSGAVETQKWRKSVNSGARGRKRANPPPCLRRSGGLSGLPRLDSNQQPSG